MRWIRDHVRQGSWLALLALVINLGLSFGHIHAIAGKGSERGFAPLIAAVTAPDGGQIQSPGQNQGHHDDGSADLLCPICMAAGAIGHALTAAPAILAMVFAETTIVLTIVAELDVPEPARAAFDSRGPPTS